MGKRMDVNPWRTYIKVVFVGGFLAGSLTLSMLIFGQLLGFVWWLPLFAWFASRWIINGACQFLAWNKAHVLGPLNGRHYAFDGIPVTIEWNEVHQSVASTG